MDDPNKITYFAETDARNKRVRFGIKAEDRLRHVYSIGKTGMGKSTMLENMAIQDIQSGEGMAFLDPHGKTADLLLDYIPEYRLKDVVYFAPFDTDFPIAFNVMEDVGPMKRHLVLAGLMSAFEKVFGEDSFSDRMQYILQNTILALLEYPGATMLGINKMLSDKTYRNSVIANITDPSVKNYWTKEYAAYTDKFAAEAIPAIQNKIGQFTSNPLIRNIIGQPKSSFDIRKLMDERKILIVNLSKGLVGESNANLLGSMLVTKIYLAAMSRADASPVELKKLPNFYLYVDEFQSFANKSFADILSEARKYKLSLNITHQYIEQMDEEVRAAVFGNVGTMICFRVGSFDAEILEKEFAPVFVMEDIVNLGKFQIYLKLMIDGVASQPFSATGLPPIPAPEVSLRQKALDLSRKTYTSSKEEVEKAISDWNSSESNKVTTPTQVPASAPAPVSTPQTPKPPVVEYKSAPRPEVKQPPTFTKSEPLPEGVGGTKVDSQVPKTNVLAEALQKAVKEKEGEKKLTEVKPTFVHLEALKKDNSQHQSSNKNKDGTPEHKNALAEALKKVQSNPVPKIEAKVEQKTELKPEVKKPIVSNIQEVPEEVLRKVLNGE